MKIFCDHCGREITDGQICELDWDDCFYDHRTEECVGVSYVLCEKCFDERQQAHINLDRVFLNIEENRE